MNFARISRNTTLTLMLTQAFGSFGAALTATVNTIVGAELSGSAWQAGLPGSFVQIGAAIAAVLIGATMDRWGRRLSLSAGMGIGVLGALIASISVMQGRFIFFLGGLMLVGFTRAAALMGRFVAAEVTVPEKRGRTISYVILGGTFGSVLGPFLADPSSRMAGSIGVEAFAGPYAAGALVFLLAGLVLFAFLRPEPRDVGRSIAAQFPESVAHGGPARPVLKILSTPTVVVAVTAMVMGQVVMVGLMGITSLHMFEHDHPIGAVSAVFSIHTLGMFAFSILTGQLLDRWGRGPVILSGAALMFVACALAPIWTDVAPLAVALFLLGLGWNFCYVGGSTLLSDVLTPEERAHTQAANDLTISLSTALASFASGVVFDFGGYAAAGIIGALASIIPFTVAGWWMTRRGLPEAIS